MLLRRICILLCMKWLYCMLIWYKVKVKGQGQMQEMSLLDEVTSQGQVWGLIKVNCQGHVKVYGQGHSKIQNLRWTWRTILKLISKSKIMFKFKFKGQGHIKVNCQGHPQAKYQSWFIVRLVNFSMGFNIITPSSPWWLMGQSLTGHATIYLLGVP